MVFLKRVLAFVLIFGAAFLLVTQLPIARGFDFKVTGWGWLAYIGGMVAYLVPYTWLRSRVDKSLGVNDQTKSSIHFALEEGGSWLCVPTGFTLGWLILPTAFAITNGLGGWVVSVVIAVAFGVEKAVQRCITQSQHAKTNKSDTDTK